MVARPACKHGTDDTIFNKTAQHHLLLRDKFAFVKRQVCFYILQVAVKNNIDVFYLSCLVPLHVMFVEDGEMDKRVFLATWKDIPSQNEVQFTINNVQHNGGRYISLLIPSFPSQNEVQFAITSLQYGGKGRCCKMYYLFGTYIVPLLLRYVALK